MSDEIMKSINEAIKGLLDSEVQSIIHAKISEYDFDKLIKQAIREYTGNEFTRVVHEEVKYLFKNTDITIKGIMSLADSVVNVIKEALIERIRKAKFGF